MTDLSQQSNLVSSGNKPGLLCSHHQEEERNNILNSIQPNSNNNNKVSDVDYLKSLEGMGINDKINSYVNIREKVFVNRNQPTMTLDEFADKQIAIMEEDKIRQKEWEEQNKIDYEDEDKEIHVDKQNRADKEWDDWKDLHQKGGGNRMGR
jgi:hypothetical protein